LFFSSGEIACQLFDMSAKVPWTRTTGRGWAAVGLQAQSLAPGGLAVGLVWA
jgi:hypothetical protein